MSRAMPPHESPRSPNPAGIIPWMLWFAVTMGFTMIYAILGQKTATDPNGPGLLGILPLAVSLALRLFALPRIGTRARAIPLYIVCLACAEAGGMMGLFLGGPHRTLVIGAAFALLLLHNPLFALSANNGDERLRGRE